MFVLNAIFKLIASCMVFSLGVGFVYMLYKINFDGDVDPYTAFIEGSIAAAAAISIAVVGLYGIYIVNKRNKRNTY